MLISKLAMKRNNKFIKIIIGALVSGGCTNQNKKNAFAERVERSQRLKRTPLVHRTHGNFSHYDRCQ